MYIEEVIIDGFKSYSARTVVGPFDPQFTAITGLNGSGKSNILDSICFVLGISNLQLVRASNLQELVYKQGQAGITKASVTIVFNNENKAQAPHGYDMPKITVTRQIVIGGKNKYLINSHNVQAQQVQNLFHSVQLNVNNPHFLIMQGRITKVINMKPPEILGMIEEAAGTRMYETKKESSQKLMLKKQAKVDEIHRILAEDITPTLERLSDERKKYLKWATNQNEVERLNRFVVAIEYTTISDEVSKGINRVKELEDQAEKHAHEIGEAAKQIADTEVRTADLIRSREDACTGSVKKLETQEAELGKVVAATESQLKNAAETVKQEKEAVQGAKSALAEGTKQIEAKQKAYSAADAAEAKAAGARASLEADLDKAQRTLQAVSSGADEEGQASLQEQLMAAQSKQSEVDGEGKRWQIELKAAQKALGPAEKEVDRAAKEGKDVTKVLDRVQKELQEAVKRRDVLKFDHRKCGEVEVKARQAKQALEDLQDQVEKLESALGRVNFQYNAPANFDTKRVKGVVARLFQLKPTHQQYSTAVEIAAGGRLFNVVVDNEQTGKALLGMQLKRRVTIIPLNKITDSSMDPARAAKAKQLCPGHVHTALEVVGFEDEVRNAMKYVFGSVLVCDSPETAQKVTFHPNVMVRSVTVQGDVYDPSGTLTGGSTGGQGQLLGRLDDLRVLTQELQKHQAHHQKVAQQWANEQHMRDEYQKLQDLVGLKEHELKMAQDRANATEHSQAVRHLESLQKQLAEGEAALGSLDARRKAIRDEVARLEKAVQNFASERKSRLTSLETQISKLRKELTQSDSGLKKSADAKKRLALEMEALQEDQKNMQDQLSKAEETLRASESKHEELTAEVAVKKGQLDKCQAELKQARAEIASADKELKKLAEDAKQQAKKKEESELALKKLRHQVSRFSEEHEEKKKQIEHLETEQPWILQERKFFGQPGTDFDFESADYHSTKKKLEELREQQKHLANNVNKKVIGMYEKAEEEHTDLLQKREIILNDKTKIESVIRDLDAKKKEALDKTWRKVSGDLGSIFATLLPNVSAKLNPVECDGSLHGLELKVAFNDVWKQSLTELSGGQKSLLALSLVLALLLFKPAPMYILDEIDAALDLSHTQNIGTMIRTHFPHSQFVIVSLKEGMFQNASCLFRTHFVDGCSKVERHELRDKSAAKAAEKPMVADKVGPRKRKAVA